MAINWNFLFNFIYFFLNHELAIFIIIITDNLKLFHLTINNKFIILFINTIILTEKQIAFERAYCTFIYTNTNAVLAHKQTQTY